MPPASLAGPRVIDCTHVIAGAYCSMLLADLGADVVKVEPIGGEGQRSRSTLAFKPFDFMNRNKRAIALDLRRPEAVAVLRQLAQGADVFVENFRPGAMDRMGLGYDDLKVTNPRLIYCSISGFGHSGPYRERGGFDLVAQAMSGIMSFTGERRTDEGEGAPVAAGVPLSDLNAGSFGALGVLAALNHRHATGEGQKVEATLLESAIGYAVWEVGLYTTMGEVAVPRGSRHRLAAPYEALKTGDGYLVVGVSNNGLWTRFCRAIAAPELEHDLRFAAPADRVANRDALQQAIEARLASAGTDHWTARLLAEGVPCGPINTIADAIADPQIAARGLVAEVDGRSFVRAPVQMSATPVQVRRGPAAVGEHTVEVLREAGFDTATIAALRATGAIEAAGN